MVVRVVADRMAFGGNRFEPIDVRLFEHLADEEMCESRRRAFLRGGKPHRIVFGCLVEIAFFVVPVRVFPMGKVAGHFQVERDGDLSFVE